MLIVKLVNNENTNAKKDGKQLEKIILSSDKWELL